MAGGPLADADLSRAQITRVVPPALRDSLHGQDRLALDVSLAGAAQGRGGDVPLCDADELVAYPIGQERRNTVTISGASVLKPGVYEYRPGLRLRDLVELAGGLKPEAFLGRAQVTRTAADRTRSVLRVDLSRALAGDPGGRHRARAARRARRALEVGRRGARARHASTAWCAARASTSTSRA